MRSTEKFGEYGGIVDPTLGHELAYIEDAARSRIRNLQKELPSGRFAFFHRDEARNRRAEIGAQVRSVG